MNILGIIPARGASKGIPGKNIVDLGGKPLIAWTIEAARQSKRLTRWIVSTDDPKIADVCASWGAEVPFMRPQELSGDTASSMDAILHALDWLGSQEGYQADYVVLLQPTSPFRKAGDIDSALALAFEKKADSVVSLAQVKEYPQWMKTVDGGGKISADLDERHQNRRQDLPSLFILNGALFIARTDVLRTRRSWYTDNTYAYIMTKAASLDIDDLEDLEMARLVAEGYKTI